MRPLLRMSGWILVAVFFTSTARAVPLSPGFTYQGQLKQSGSLVTGTRHLRFSMWDAAGSGVPPVGGSQMGGSQLFTNVTITNGLFTVLMNDGGQFGPNAFNGDARWLQIEVCADVGCATLTILSPRLALTATPFANYASGQWQTSGSNISFTGGKVGIGTASPGYKLEVVNTQSGEAAYIHSEATSGTNYGVNGQANGVGATRNVGGYFAATGAANNHALIVPPDRGNVGIGTTAPSLALLEVRQPNPGFASYIRAEGTSGTNYGIDAEAAGVGAAKNIAGYFAASGGAENHAIVVPPFYGHVGIGTTSPGYPLEVASTNQNGTVAFVHSDRPTGDNYAVNGQANGVGANTNVGGYFQAIGASNNIAIQVPPFGGNVDIGSFTKLGSDAPAIKTKKLTGTSPASNESQVIIPHGLDYAKILSVSVLIDNGGFGLVPMALDAINGWHWWVSPAYVNVYIRNRDDCLSKPMRIFITYEE